MFAEVCSTSPSCGCLFCQSPCCSLCLGAKWKMPSASGHIFALLPASCLLATKPHLRALSLYFLPLLKLLTKSCFLSFTNSIKIRESLFKLFFHSLLVPYNSFIFCYIFFSVLVTYISVSVS